jgi:ferredoxin--NADP+ reductase
LFVERVLPQYGGRLTPVLHARQVGDRVTFRPVAKGRFTRRAGVTNHVMIATVTGIAPYVSMIRQFIHESLMCPRSVDHCRFFVMQGASHRDEFRL